MAGTAVNIAQSYQDISGSFNFAPVDVITSHRPTEGFLFREREFIAPIQREESTDFHRMLMEEDIHRISYLGYGRGILTLTKPLEGDGFPTLRLWSSPDTGSPGAFSKLNPPTVLQELRFDAALECLAVNPQGTMVAIVVDGMLGLYEVDGQGDGRRLLHRASRLVQSLAEKTADISFGSDGRNLRFTSPEGETRLLTLSDEGHGILGDVLEGW